MDTRSFGWFTFPATYGPISGSKLLSCPISNFKLQFTLHPGSDAELLLYDDEKVDCRLQANWMLCLWASHRCPTRSTRQTSLTVPIGLTPQHLPRRTLCTNKGLLSLRQRRKLGQVRRQKRHCWSRGWLRSFFSACCSACWTTGR